MLILSGMAFKSVLFEHRCFTYIASCYILYICERHAHGDLCKHLGIDSSTDHPDRYSNLFLNAYTNRHAHTEYLRKI